MQTDQPQRVTRPTWEIRQGSTVASPRHRRLATLRARQVRARRKRLEGRVKQAEVSSQVIQNQMFTGYSWRHFRSIAGDNIGTLGGASSLCRASNYKPSWRSAGERQLSRVWATLFCLTAATESGGCAQARLIEPTGPLRPATKSWLRCSDRPWAGRESSRW